MDKTIEERLGCRDETDFKPKFIGIDWNEINLSEYKKRLFFSFANLESRLLKKEVSWEYFKECVENNSIYYFISTEKYID